jgi:hypothetical protein
VIHTHTHPLCSPKEHEGSSTMKHVHLHPFRSRNDEGLPQRSTPHTRSLRSPNEHKESSSTTHAHLSPIIFHHLGDLSTIIDYTHSHIPELDLNSTPPPPPHGSPATHSEEVLKTNGGRARAVVVSSGCANAVTGKQGLEDAWAMVRETDALLPPSLSPSPPKNKTLVMSTGVIGQTLPISKIITGIRS